MFGPCPEVIKLFHPQHNWAWNFKRSCKLKCWNKKTFLAFKLADVVFIMLTNVKMPTCVGILTFMSIINFMLSWVEHKKSFITSRPGFVASLSRAISVLAFVSLDRTELVLLCFTCIPACMFVSLFSNTISLRRHGWVCYLILWYFIVVLTCFLLVKNTGWLLIITFLMLTPKSTWIV